MNPDDSVPTAEQRDVDLMGMRLAPLTESDVVAHIGACLKSGRGGWLLTANLDILRLFARDPDARAVYEQAELCVADGMPLVWASRLRGDPLPERVAGSTLCELLVAQCAELGLGVVLLGGAPGSAEAAAEALRARHPELQIAANSAVRFSAVPSDEEVALTAQQLRGARSRLVLVGLGSPKQERVILRLREILPDSYFVGVGGSFSFLAGDVARAPALMQRLGLEWVHRLAQEPRRLAKRYLIEDLPFFVALIWYASSRRQ